MVYGYIRVSTQDQHLGNQELEIRRFAERDGLNIDKFITISVSSRRSFKERRLDELINELQEDDVLIVTEISRLARSVSEFIRLIDIFTSLKVRLVIIKQNLDIKSGKGIDATTRLILNVFFSIAELEKNMISERTKMGLERAKENGTKLGRPKGSLSSKLDSKKQRIIELHQLGVTKLNIAKQINVNYQTLCCYMRKLRYE